jgi:type IV secretory pathway VirD2 relaxase
MRVRPRRVAVKARVVKLAGKAKAVTAHLRYLERDGVSRDGEPGRFYSTFADEVDGKAFMERGQGDRHQFRLIVAPEDGAAFENLRGATRDLMAKMEQDLGTNLDWIAVDHFDTGHPHSHILIRGVTEDGKTLNIAGDYIAHGIRHRASQIMTRALGPQSELEVQQQLSQEVDAERLTRLDRAILQRARDNAVDLRQMVAASGDGGFQQLLVSRVRQLERMELAEPAGPLVWSLSPAMEKALTDMGRRGDIIRTMHERMTAGKLERRPDLYMIHDPARENGPVVGKVLYRGAADDDHDRRYLIIDGGDGHTHYVDIGTSDLSTPIGGLVSLESKQPSLRKADLTIVEVAAANEGQYTIDFHLKHDRSATEDFTNTHVRRLEAIRRATGAIERMPDGTWIIAPDHLDRVMDHEQRQVRAEPMKIEMLSFAPVEKQTDLHAATWLDRETVVRDKLELADHGYGRDVYRALLQRQQWLIEQQLVEQDGGDLLIKRNMLAILRQREVRAVAGQLSKDLGIPFEEAAPGKPIEGTYRRSINLASGRYALIEKSREFTLVPWRPELEKQIGRTVSGIMRTGGGVSWTIGRQRGPQIGM